MKTLENKTAIVTGAGSGIGRAVAILYATEGANVVVSDVNEKGSNETVEMIKKNGGEAIFVKCDTSKPAECEALVNATVAKYGGLHIACNLTKPSVVLLAQLHSFCCHFTLSNLVV